MATSIELMEDSPSFQIYDIVCLDNRVITTTVTDTPSRVVEWICKMKSIYYGARSLRKDDLVIVGLDFEYNPSWGSHHSPVATVQLCINNRCLIFQLIHANSIPNKLKSFLSNKRYTFVGAGLKKDLEKLQKDYGFGMDANVVDLGSVAAKRYGRKKLKVAGLNDLCAVVLGKQMLEKPFDAFFSSWNEVSLDMDQVMCACLDAVVSYEIGVALRADLA